jgi:hypothetical protein
MVIESIPCGGGRAKNQKQKQKTRHAGRVLSSIHMKRVRQPTRPNVHTTVDAHATSSQQPRGRW